MAGNVQQIRRIHPAKFADFDDQLWPINVAIVILAGFVAGIVIATSDFDDPRLVYNGWARLLSVGLMVVLLFWGVVLLQGKMLRRLQLCVMISLLAHLWLAVYLHGQFLALLPERKSQLTEQVTERYERITVPDYHWQQIDQPEARQGFEEPIETEAPKPTEPEVFERKLSRREVATDLSAPRRADAPAGAQISRQEWKHYPRPNEPALEPIKVAQRQGEQPAHSDQPTVRPVATAVRRTADRLMRVRQDRPPDRVLPAMTRAAQLPSVVAARWSAAMPAAISETPASRIAWVVPSATVRRAAAQLATTGGAGRPSASSNASTPRIARTIAPPAASTVASDVPQPAPMAPGAIAAGGGPPKPPKPSPSIRASAARRGGTIGRLAAVALSGGGSSKPGRTFGGALMPTAAAEAAEVAMAAPRGGKPAAAAPPVPVPLSGPQRQVAGLPGSLESQPMADAGASFSRDVPAPAAGTAIPGIGRAATVGPAIATPGPIEAEPVAEPSRQQRGLPVQIAAAAGPGGLSYDPSPVVGLGSRRARPESQIIHTVSRRFVIRRSGGQLAIDGRVREQPAEAFRRRDRGRRTRNVLKWGGGEGTEEAVEMGLDFFARHQFPDGHWSLHELPEGVDYQDPGLGQMQADSAATGLVLLTYLGAGYTHLDDKHRVVVNRGIDWLVRNQKDDGDLFTGGTKYAWLYSHGIATIALCEAYGMTRDAELCESARKAVDFICTSQHPTRGGWRYEPNKESDTSVSGWMLMALKSAQMAGLEVPAEVLEKVDDWLNTAQAPDKQGQYVYNPHAKDIDKQREGRKPNLAMTSEAMLMRMYLGHENDDPQLIAGADHLKENLPEVGTRTKSLRDCYYWYYATQSMFHMRGDYWTAWNDRLRPLAQSNQVQFGPAAGSWHPDKPVPDRWGHAGGRTYVTALHLLMLEVYYRHLPLFQELSR